MFRITNIQHYINIMSAWGYTPESVLSGTGITNTDLDDPNFLVDIKQHQIVVANMLSLTGDNALGFKVGKEIKFSDMDILGYALMSASTIRRALDVWFSYSQPIYGSVLDIDLKDDNQGWHLSVNAFLPFGQVYRFCIEEFLMICHYVGTQLSGHKVVFTRLELAYPQPQHIDIYRRLFPCPLIFNSQRNRISGSMPALDTEVKSNNPELNEMYMRFCKQMSGELTGRTPLAIRVRNYLVKTPNKIPSINEVAMQMNCSERTLRRHLKDEGISYRQLVNEFRCDLAEEYLTSTYLTPSQIGYLLGYQDTKPFLRAFKSWTGKTVGEFRKAKRNQV